VKKLALTIALSAGLGAVTAPAALGYVSISSNPRGDQVLVDHVLFQSGERPLYASTRAPGESFGELTPITPADASYGGTVGVDDSGGALALASGLAFEGDSATRVTERLLTRPPGGAFVEAGTLEPDAEGRPSLAVGPGGDALAFWPHFDGPGRYRFRPAGGEFGADAPMPGKQASFSSFSITPDGTTVYIWREGVAGGDGMFESVRPPRGEFGPPKEIAGVPQRTEIEATSSRSGRVLLFWIDGHSVRGMERPPDGQFGPAFKIATVPLRFFNIHSAALADSGAAALVLGYDRTYLVARDTGQDGFAKPQQLTRSSEDLTAPGAVVDERGDAAVAWFDARRRVLVSYRRAGGTVDRPRLLAATPQPIPQQPDVPALAIRANGRATAAWEMTDAVTVRTYARDFDAKKAYRRQIVGSLPSFVREGPPEACTPQGATVLLQSPQATVFETDGVTHGCLSARGAPFRLLHASEESTQAVESMALAGPLVAYASNYLGHSQFSTSINVTDLRDPDSGVNRGAFVEGFDHGAVVVATRLRPNGAVAWIDCPLEPNNQGDCSRVGGAIKHLFGWNLRAKEPRRLDSGRRIDAGSFRLRGSKLTWRKRGKLHHATLR
jgi:hypothetical protein